MDKNASIELGQRVDARHSFYRILAISAYTYYLESDLRYRRELPRLLRAAYFGMHRISDAHFASHGLTADQFVVLACLAEQDAIMQKDLARFACSDPSTIRAMLVLLEGRGLVARVRNPDDSRARLVMLAPKGRRLFERCWKSSEPIRVQMVEGFSTDETRLFVTYLRRLIENTSTKKSRRERPRSKSASSIESENQIL